ncbi:lipase family alpha/beta hydrolase [Nocardioides marmorisolisilvae]|uniref:Lipase n=1 Tax=Nocardioides marmorisolisilvae TaxID=1542737 RepID=A0A3N0DZ88_9ACTN|nr:lipase [Nocardioides marmorisolisilvae]RNL80928.1 lipase [Nocardioides marmorisolisilvae]
MRPLPSLVRAALALLAAALLASVLVAPSGTAATASAYAPLNRPGPALHVAKATLAKALVCHNDLRTAPGEPVLLSPATGVTPVQNYSWNYERAFRAQKRAWCTVTMPFHTLGDIQTAGEYLVYAIRTMHAKAGRRIAVMGHSQGGMSMRWALRFWPDTRAMVDDVIGMAGSNHGTKAAALSAPEGSKLPPASLQQGAGSNFIKALNSGAETFAGISYTEIYTHTDEVVQPNNTAANSSSSLHTGNGMITNVATQSVCHGDVFEHLTVGTIDPTTYALVMDALTHKGPAVPSRIGRASCSKLYQPGVDPTNVQTYVQVLAAAPGLLAVSVPFVNVVGAPEVSKEPALRCYVYADGC